MYEVPTPTTKLSMRHSAEWNVVWDDRVLEWVRENDGSGTAAEINQSNQLRTSKSTISRRLQKLADNNLLTHVGNGAYIITEEGEGYLDEEYDVEEGVWLDQTQATGDGPAASSTSSENGV